MTIVTHNLNHRTVDCKYDVVFPPKSRKQVLYGMSRRDLRDVGHHLAKHQACVIEAGHLMPGHVPMLMAIASKPRVATILGFLKGKSSIGVAQTIANQRRHFAGPKCRARGYFVSTVGANEKVIRSSIENQEKADKRLDDLFDRS